MQVYRPPLEIRDSNSSEASVFNIFNPASNFSSRTMLKKPDFYYQKNEPSQKIRKESNPSSSLQYQSFTDIGQNPHVEKLNQTTHESKRSLTTLGCGVSVNLTNYSTNGVAAGRNQRA